MSIEIEGIKKRLAEEPKKDHRALDEKLIDLIVQMRQLGQKSRKKAKSTQRFKAKPVPSKYSRGISRECKKWVDYKTFKAKAERTLINCDKLKRISRFRIR